MITLKTQSEQCIFILTTKYENNAQLSELSSNIREYLFYNKSFPIISLQDVKLVTKISNSEGKIFNVLQKIKFPINYDSIFLENEILKNPSIIQRANEYVSLLIFHFYISFFRTKNYTTKEITTLLKCLLLIIRNKVSNNEKFQIYGLSCFTTIILDKQYNIDYSNQDFLSCISDFFNLPKIPQESLNVLQNMLEQIGNSNKKEVQLENSLQLINYTFQKYRPLFTKEFIKNIFLNLRYHLINLNYISLTFLNQLIEVVEDQDLEMYINAFPLAIIPYYITNKENKQTKIDFGNSYSTSPEKSLKIVLPERLEDKIPALDKNELDMRSLHFEISNGLVSIAKSRNRKYTDIFISEIIRTIKTNELAQCYELLAIYLHLLVQLSPLSPEFCDKIAFLFAQPYFTNPNYLIGSSNNEKYYLLDKKVSSIRLILANLLIRQNFDFVQDIFHLILNQKLNFPEFCYRFVYVNDDYKIAQLSSILFNLYSITSSSNLNQSRIACVLTLLNYFNSPELRSEFFNNVVLYKYAFSFINRTTERRQFILRFMKEYFLTCRGSINQTFSDKLIQFFDIVSDEIINNLNNETSLFILDLIKFCTEILNANTYLCRSFQSFFDKVCLVLAKLTKENPYSKSLFINAFSMFLVHSITTNESSAIETSALTLFGSTPDLKKLIISLMGAENEDHDEFIIKQPKSVALLLNLFMEEKTLLPFLTKLCKYSPINASYYHDAGLDSLILEKLIEIKKENDVLHEKQSDENIDKSYIDNRKSLISELINLFYEIAKQSSSIHIVNRYMSLLCSNPNNNRLSDFHIMFVRLLNKLAHDVQFIPMTAFYEPQEFHDIEVVYDWTVCIWLFIAEKIDSPILKVSKNDFTYEISIKYSSLILNVNSIKKDYELKCELPIYNWFCLTLKVEPSKTVLFINNDKACEVSHTSFFMNQNADFTFYSNKKIFIGGMSIYNSIIEASLYDVGPRNVYVDSEKTLALAVHPIIHNNQLQSAIFPKTISSANSNRFTKSFSIMSFIDILCERCGISLIFPLLAQVKMDNADDKLYMETLDIIYNLMKYRINSQIKFSEMSGIQILAHLITKTYAQKNLKITSNSSYDFTSSSSNLISSSKDSSIVKKYLNYDVYSKLVDIYRTLNVDKLKKKFLKYILVNLGIWVNSEPDVVVKICQFLAEQDKESFWNFYKLNYTLTIAAFRVFFSLENYKNLPRFEGQKEDMYKIRENLITLSRDFCDSSISNSDFLIVLSHLKVSSNMSEELDLYNYLKEIIQKDSKEGKNIKPESKLMICYLLRKCIKTKVIENKNRDKNKSKPPTGKHSRNLPVEYDISCDFELLIQVIKLFYNSINVHYVNKSDFFTINMGSIYGSRNVYQRDLVYYLMRWISDVMIDENLLKLLIPLINSEYPYLFQLGCMISISLGKDHFLNFLEEVKFNPIIIEDDNCWPIWIILGVNEFLSQEDEESKGIKFLLDNSMPDQWTNIFLMILNFTLNNDNFKSHIPNLFLHTLVERVDNQEKCGIFINLAIYFLFLRKVENKLIKTPTNSAIISNKVRYASNMNDAKQIDNSSRLLLTDRRSSNLFSRFYIPTPSIAEFEEHVESIDPKKNKKFSMHTIDEILITIKKNIVECQNVLANPNMSKKSNDNKGQWFDLSLSNRIIDMFLTYPSMDYVYDVILVEAFRLKYLPQSDKVINKYVIEDIKLDEIKEHYSISYFNKICQKFNIKSPFKQAINESHLTEEFRKRKIEVVISLNNSYKAIAVPIKNIQKVFMFYSKEQTNHLNSTFQQTIQGYVTDVILRKTKSKRRWNKLCASIMRCTETPWYSSIKHDIVHYKRDFSSCYCFCPSKIKVNKKYNQHLEASFRRNTGSQKTAKELYNEILSKMKNKEAHNLYGDLYDVELNESQKDLTSDVSKYIFTADCQVIKVSKEVESCLMLSKDSITIQSQNKVKEYPLNSIDKVLLRDHLHRPTAIEIFFNNGSTLFLNFVDATNNLVVEQIMYQALNIGDRNGPEIQTEIPFKKYFKSKKITQMWLGNKISNFEYLMLLNIYSGRSFNNSSQYPFLPWIIMDYESEKINPIFLRDLSLPVGALNQERLQRLLKNYEEKKTEGMKPFLYSSGQTCPLALYYWLVRVEPFTTYHIEMQGGTFDNSDRVFSSWKKAAHLVLTMDDMYRELPPEAFYMHDFMVNYNNLSLGLADDANLSASNKEINDYIKSIENFNPSSQNVELPPWSSDYIEFVYLNRKALESEIVSRNLHNWIDLIWGFKQNGPEAEKANNVYRPEMYHDVWSTPLGEDKDNWPLIETYLSQVGQVPVQLFDSPHPRKRNVGISKLNIKVNKMTNESSYLSIEDGDMVDEPEPQNSRQVVKIQADEIKEFVGAQIVTKRTTVNEAHMSFNYNLKKNVINVIGINGNGEVTVIKIGYKDIEIPSQTTLSPKSKQSLAKALISKIKSDKPTGRSEFDDPFYVDPNSITYSTEVIKEYRSLTTDVKAKMSSSSKKNFTMKFAFLSESKICYSDNVQNVLLLDDMTAKTEKQLLLNQNKVTALAYDGEKFLTSFDSDGFLSVLQVQKSDSDLDESDSSISLSVLYTIPSFHDRIYCCDISKDFHQIVCGSSDGFISIFSLSSQTFLRTIKVEKEPKFIMITKSWGFILAVLTEVFEGKIKTFLNVWSINGDFIRSKEIDYEISKITTWRSKSGFDYYLLATTPGSKIVAGEVFTLEDFFEYSADDDVVSLGYDYDLENAIVLTKDGVISFLPCSPPALEF